jgi:hypothetical protein
LLYNREVVTVVGYDPQCKSVKAQNRLLHPRLAYARYLTPPIRPRRLERHPFHIQPRPTTC